MSKAKFAAAKELIDEKQYDSARAILKTIDHPVAREWETKLDALSPAVEAASSKDTKFFTNSTRFVIAVVLTGIFVIIILALIQRAAIGIVDSHPEIANSIISTTNGQITIDSTSTAAAQLAPTKETVKTQAVPTFTLTSSATSTNTLTATPAPTETATPSATITNTPIPSATPLPTATPTNTITPSPTHAPFGLKENPYPPRAPGSVRDGRMQVNQFQRNQTATIKQINMFNPDPPAGGEWVIVNVTFYCDLSSSQTCNVGMMDLELTGKLGTIYTKGFAVLTSEFTGEAFGGGQVTGNVAFIVNSSDSGFIFIVNDLGNRAFFGTGG